MLQVNRSKELRNVQQLQRMSQNLSKKFGDYCSVTVYAACLHYPVLEYKIWLGHVEVDYRFKSWRECQNKYFELMKGGGDSGKCQ
jgi:GH25 family lysozyme M1 (1,4-beta-N-acetylmuramidase)